MDLHRNAKTVSRNRVSGLIATVAQKDFGAAALAFLSSTARFENFGAYHIADLAEPQPSLSFWSGRISDYWFQRDADIILNTPETLHRIVTQIQGAPAGGAHIERWHPSENDTRKATYARNGILERVAVSSKNGRTGLRSFYLRSATDGWLNESEFENVCDDLLIVHELIGIRHQIVGTSGQRLHATSSASRLRDFNVPAFAELSPREAIVCDLLLQGSSVAATALEMAVSEATIRTLRARAYRKLNVSSATQLMALFVRSQTRV